MFRYSLASASMLAVAQAMAFKQQMNGGLDFLQPLNLAQTGNDCCCSVMPCMPTCEDACPDPHVIIPDNKEVAAPKPVQDVVFNLDVILTTLLHQQAKPLDEISLVPEPDTPDELKYVNEVITPIIIQIINNDIMPAIPTCTFPKGSTGADYGLAEGSWIHGGETEAAQNTSGFSDPLALAKIAIMAALESSALPEGIDLEKLVDDALIPAQGALLDVQMTDEQVGQEISMIIKTLETSINNWTASISSEEKMENEALGIVTEDLMSQLQEAGLPADQFTDEISEVISSI